MAEQQYWQEAVIVIPEFATRSTLPQLRDEALAITNGNGEQCIGVMRYARTNPPVDGYPEGYILVLHADKPDGTTAASHFAQLDTSVRTSVQDFPKPHPEQQS